MLAANPGKNTNQEKKQEVISRSLSNTRNSSASILAILTSRDTQRTEVVVKRWKMMETKNLVMLIPTPPKVLSICFSVTKAKRLIL